MLVKPKQRNRQAQSQGIARMLSVRKMVQ